MRALLERFHLQNEFVRSGTPLDARHAALLYAALLGAVLPPARCVACGRAAPLPATGECAAAGAGDGGVRSCMNAAVAALWGEVCTIPAWRALCEELQLVRTARG